LAHLAIEGLALEMQSESKPEHMKMKISLDNLYIRDFYSPNEAFPYVIQSILTKNLSQNHGSGLEESKFSKIMNKHYASSILEIEYETNPKDNKEFIGNQRLKFHTYGQIYIYSNLEFARRMVDFTARVLQVMNKNYKTMVDRAPE
jgi:hypothetical protein